MLVPAVVWIAIVWIAILLVATWALFKLYELFRPTPSPVANIETGLSDFTSKSNLDSNMSSGSALTTTSSGVIIRPDGVDTIGHRLANRYLSPKQTVESVKSVKMAKLGSDIKSDGSRKSFGFEPLVKKYKGNNFLAILDEINALDEEEEQRRLKKRDRRIRTASSVGIDADSTDETASQTFIGKASAVSQQLPDPGGIQLGFIKAQESGESSSEFSNSPALE